MTLVVLLIHTLVPFTFVSLCRAVVRMVHWMVSGFDDFHY